MSDDGLVLGELTSIDHEDDRRGGGYSDGDTADQENVPVLQCCFRAATHLSTPIRGECHTVHAIFMFF